MGKISEFKRSGCNSRLSSVIQIHSQKQKIKNPHRKTHFSQWRLTRWLFFWPSLHCPFWSCRQPVVQLLEVESKIGEDLAIARLIKVRTQEQPVTTARKAVVTRGGGSGDGHVTADVVTSQLNTLKQQNLDGTEYALNGIKVHRHQGTELNMDFELRTTEHNFNLLPAKR